MGPRVEELLAELDALANWPDELHRLDSTDRTVAEMLAKLEGVFASR